MGGFIYRLPRLKIAEVEARTPKNSNLRKLTFGSSFTSCVSKLADRTSRARFVNMRGKKKITYADSFRGVAHS